MRSAQERPVPETNSGKARHASKRRRAALARSGPKPAVSPSTRHALGQIAQWNGVVRRGAAVDADRHGLRFQRAHFRNRRAHELLHGMIRPLVVRGRNAQVPCQRQKAGVLAGAIVVNAARLAAFADHGVRRRLIQRQMRTASEIALLAVDAPQPIFDAFDVHGLAAVRGAGERKFVGLHRERIGPRRSRPSAKACSDLKAERG